MWAWPFVRQHASDETQGVCTQFPACYEEPVVRMVHHALAKPDEMVTRLLAHFKERLVPGEEAVALRSGAPAPCIIVQSLGPDGLDAGASAGSSCMMHLCSDAFVLCRVWGCTEACSQTDQMLPCAMAALHPAAASSPWDLLALMLVLLLVLDA